MLSLLRWGWVFVRNVGNKTTTYAVKRIFTGLILILVLLRETFSYKTPSPSRSVCETCGSVGGILKMKSAICFSFYELSTFQTLVYISARTGQERVVYGATRQVRAFRRLWVGKSRTFPSGHPVKSDWIDEVFQLQYSYGTLTVYSLPVTGCTNSLTFNNCTVCTHCVYGFCIYLRKNSDLCHLQHKLIGFYNRDEKCLLRGTNWVFK